MLVERVVHNSTIVVSDLINGHLETRRYIGYSPKEAVAEFKQEMKDATKTANGTPRTRST